jgi:hypothetical protein
MATTMMTTSAVSPFAPLKKRPRPNCIESPNRILPWNDTLATSVLAQWNSRAHTNNNNNNTHMESHGTVEFQQYPVITICHTQGLSGMFPIDDDVSSLEDSVNLQDDDSMSDDGSESCSSSSSSSSNWSSGDDDEDDDWDMDTLDDEMMEGDDEDDCEYDSVQSQRETAAAKALVQAVMSKTLSWPQIAPLLDLETRSSKSQRHSCKRWKRGASQSTFTTSASYHDYDGSTYSSDDGETVESSVYDPDRFTKMGQPAILL